MKRIGLVLIVMAIGLSGAGALTQVRAEVALRAAIEQETVKGDLKGAIEAYRKIVDGYRDNRPVRAQALIRMADAYRRLGDAQAKQVYERVIKEFADQKEQVTIARTRIGQPAMDGALTARRVLTLPPGADAATHVSRDGRFLSYLSDGNLVIRSLTGGGQTHLINARTNEEIDGARLSRDGGHVAFSVWNTATSPSREELYVSRVSTSATDRKPLESHTRLSYADVCDWTPDGTRVATLLSDATKPGELRLAFFSVADGKLEEIHALSSIADSDGGCAISPDGESVAYHRRGSSGAADIFVTTLAGRRAAAVVVHPAEDRLVGWTPAGDALIFASRRAEGSGLWLMRVTGGAPVGEAQFLTEQSGDHQHLGISNAGVVFSSPLVGSTGTGVKVGAFDFSTGQWRTAPSGPVEDERLGTTWQADWSPDGKELSYVSSRGRSSAVLDVVFRSTEPRGLQRAVTVPLRSVRWLRWTRDGSAVVLSGMHPDGTSSVWKIDREGGDVVRVGSPIPGIPDAFAAWAADGKRLYSHRQSADGALQVIEREWPAGQEREVFKIADRAADPVFSPDGSKLYYRRTLSQESERVRTSVVVERHLATKQEREISDRRNLGGMNLSPDGRYIATGSNDPAAKTRSFVLIPTAGGETRALMSVALPDNWPAVGGANPLGLHVWAPDSSSMILRNDGTGELWWVPIDGTAPRKVSSAGMGNVTSASPWRIHPDGTKVVFHSDTATPPKPAELWVIENFLPLRNTQPF